MSSTHPAVSSAARYVICVAFILLGGFLLPAHATVHAAAVGDTGSGPIRHIVIMIRENRTYDNLFGRFPRGDGSTRGRLADGSVVPLSHTPLRLPVSPTHTGDAARVAIAGGKMKGLRRLPKPCQH